MTKMKQFVAISFAACAMFASPVMAADTALDDEHAFTVGISMDSTSGKYGSAYDFRVETATLSLSKDIGDVTLSVNVPYQRQTGPVGSIIVAGRPVIVDGAPEIRNGKVVVGKATTKIRIGTEDGVGDMDTSATYFFENDNPKAPLIDVKFDIKWDNGNESEGLGTGKFNYTLGGDISQSWGKWLGSLSLGYTEVGKIPGAQMKNYFLETADISRKIGLQSSVGVTMNAGNSTTIGGPQQRDLSLYYGYAINKSDHLQAYVLKGLANGSPDRGLGVSGNVEF